MGDWADGGEWVGYLLCLRHSDNKLSELPSVHTLAGKQPVVRKAKL